MDIKKLLEESYRKNFLLWTKQMFSRNVTIEMAEDAIQDACIRAMTYGHTFDPAKGFDEWFSRIRRNALMDILAQERQGGLHVEYKEELDGRAYVASQPSEFMEQVLAEVDRLPESRKEICRLYFFFGMAPREIEKLVANNNKSIRDIIFRFKKHLKEKYRNGE